MLIPLRECQLNYFRTRSQYDTVVFCFTSKVQFAAIIFLVTITNGYGFHKGCVMFIFIIVKYGDYP